MDTEMLRVHVLFILRDAIASSVVGTMHAAIEARKGGKEAAVLVTQEALAALVRGSFAWPRELAGQEMRLGMASRAASLGLPITGRGEGRQIDVRAMVPLALEAGVRVFACPLWTGLLGLEEGLPPGVERLDAAQAQELITGAQVIIGSL